MRTGTKLLDPPPMMVTLNGIRRGPFGFFFFSSRRRHTRFDCDWSSDVCSSDLVRRSRLDRGADAGHRCPPRHRSEERRVGKSVDLGGRRIIKKKKKKENI